MAGRTSSKRAPVRPRSERLEARVSSEQKALFQRAADLQGRTLTDFVIASVHESAVKAIAEMEAIRLTPADSRAFAEALLHPREPIPELRTAAERYRKMVAGIPSATLLTQGAHMSARLLLALISVAFAVSISLVPGLATPAQAMSDDPVCMEGTGGLCESTCGEDFPGVQITEVCATYNGQTSCECCCYYEEMN